MSKRLLQILVSMRLYSNQSQQPRARETESECERAISLANLLTLPSSSIKANTFSIAKSFDQLQLCVAIPYIRQGVLDLSGQRWENWWSLIKQVTVTDLNENWSLIKTSFIFRYFSWASILNLQIYQGIKSSSNRTQHFVFLLFVDSFLKLFNFAWRISALNRSLTEAAKLFELCTSLS